MLFRSNRARIRRLVREAEAYLGQEGITPVTEEYFFKDGAEPDAKRVETAREVIGRELKMLARELRGSFFAGESPTAADFVLYPYLAYVSRITFRKPETRLVELEPAEICAWRKRLESMPYYDKTFPPHWRG